MNVVFGRLGVASCQWHRVSSTVDNAYAFSAGKIIFFFEKRKKKSIFSRYVVFPLQTVASERWKRVIKYIYFKKLERIDLKIGGCWKRRITKLAITFDQISTGCKMQLHRKT